MNIDQAIAEVKFPISLTMRARCPDDQDRVIYYVSLAAAQALLSDRERLMAIVEKLQPLSIKAAKHVGWVLKDEARDRDKTLQEYAVDGAAGSSLARFLMELQEASQAVALSQQEVSDGK